MPPPAAAAPATQFDEVTKGYVPWSMSRSEPCAEEQVLSGAVRVVEAWHVGDQRRGRGERKV